MPNKTKNLGLNTFLENEVVDFEQINENFELIDKKIFCMESGTVTSNYTGGSSNVATWRYKKYSDGTVEMSTKIEFTNIKCNGGEAAPYYSGDSELFFPFALSSVYDVHIHLASNTIGWVSDITGHSVIDKVMFRVMAMQFEEDYIYKQVFVNVKGVLA